MIEVLESIKYRVVANRKKCSGIHNDSEISLKMFDFPLFQPALSELHIHSMGSCYKFDDNNNSEIKFR